MDSTKGVEESTPKVLLTVRVSHGIMQQAQTKGKGAIMARNKSILNLKSKCKPDPLVATRQLENGRWQAAIMFPGAVEALVFDRPTERGLENEIIHQCRKRNHLGYRGWDTLQEVWNNVC